MQAIFILLNIMVFAVGTCAVLQKHLTTLNKGLNAIIAMVLTFTLISYGYYLCLMLPAGFMVLMILLSLSNVFLIAAHFKAFKNLMFLNHKNSDYHVYPLFIMLLLSGYFYIYAQRWGDWDAVAIWNMHARFLYDASNWTALFNNTIGWTHPDYPLMLPGFIAFLWRALGNINAIVPAITAWFPLLMVPMGVYFALYNHPYKWLAWLAMGLFVVNNRYITIACSQGADTLLSLFILLAFILFNHTRNDGQKLIYVLGFIAASAMWVKNEGILFWLVFSLVFTITYYKQPGFLKAYFIGAVAPLIILLSFKLFYSPPNDLIAGNAGDTIFQKITDYSRYFITAKYLAAALLRRYIDMVILLFTALLITPVFFKSKLFIIALLIIAGYFMVYVTTPHDLIWHLSTSADRVLQHVYPALVYVIVYSIQQWFKNNNRTVIG